MEPVIAQHRLAIRQLRPLTGNFSHEFSDTNQLPARLHRAIVQLRRRIAPQVRATVRRARHTRLRVQNIARLTGILTTIIIKVQPTLAPRHRAMHHQAVRMPIRPRRRHTHRAVQITGQFFTERFHKKSIFKK